MAEINQKTQEQLEQELDNLAIPRSTPATYDKNGQPLSFVFDDIWDFSESQATLGNAAKIDFLRYGIFKESIQAATYILLKQDKEHFDKETPIKTVNLNATAIHTLSKIISPAPISDLSKDTVFKQLTNAIKKTGYSEATVERYFCVLNNLHTAGICNRYIANPKSESKVLGRPSKQHICLPEHFASRYLNSLIKYVEKFHPYRHEISETYEAKFTYDEKRLREGMHPATLRKRKHKKFVKIGNETHDIGLSATLHKRIILNCMSLTMMLTGTRFSEACSLTQSSYNTKKVNGQDIPYVRGITTKPNQGEPKEVDWVTHPIVKKALELAWDSSQWARERFKVMGFNADKCFIVACTNKLKKEKTIVHYAPNDLTAMVEEYCTKNRIYPTAEDIAEFDLINPTRAGQFIEGEAPQFSSHTYRRTFAVFLTRNGIGDLLDIKYQYKHLNLAMSRWYTNNSNLAAALDLKMDEELAKEVHAINVEITSQLLFNIQRSRTLSGVEGQRWAEARDQNGGAPVYSLEELRKKVKSGAISIVDHPFAYCLNPNCDLICSSELSKYTCAHTITTREKAQAQLPELERLKERFRKANTGQYVTYGLLKHLTLKIEAIEKNLGEHNISITPFNEKIKAKPIFTTSGNKNE